VVTLVGDMPSSGLRLSSRVRSKRFLRSCIRKKPSIVSRAGECISNKQDSPARRVIAGYRRTSKQRKHSRYRIVLAWEKEHERGQAYSAAASHSRFERTLTSKCCWVSICALFRYYRVLFVSASSWVSLQCVAHSLQSSNKFIQQVCVEMAQTGENS